MILVLLYFIFAQVYDHLHSLDLEFQLNRQTGGLTNTMERGTRGIGQALSIILFSIFPTALELTFTCIVLWRNAGPEFAAIAFTTVLLYTLYTSFITDWRTKKRRAMNLLDKRTSQIAVDGLMNYETVKYFNQTQHEVSRYDDARGEYVAKATEVHTSLFYYWMNVFMCVLHCPMRI